MNDSDLAAARTFHSRLVDLLRVEFASLGAFLEALELAAELKPRTQVPTRTVVTRVQASRPVEPVEEVEQTFAGIRPGLRILHILRQ